MPEDTAAVVFRHGARGQGKSPCRGHVQIEGRRYPAWWAGGSTAHTTCWVTDDEVLWQHWRYHPQYDQTPQVRLERVALSKFLAGQGQADVATEFGSPALQSIIAQATRQGAAAATSQLVRPQRPAREWSFHSGATGWNVVCTVSDSGVSVHRRIGEDGRTDDYVAYTFQELCEAEVQRCLERDLGEGIAEAVRHEASDRWGRLIPKALQAPVAPSTVTASVGGSAAHARLVPWQLRWRALRKTVVTRLRRPFDWVRRTGQWSSEEVSSLLSLVTGVALILWLVASAVLELGDHGHVWWHARVAQDLVSVRARVVSHDVSVFSSDGSWAHKSNPSSNRRTSYQVTPIVEFDYPGEQGATVRGRCAYPQTFGRRADALALMSERYALGSEVSMLRVPGRDAHLLFWADQAPSTAGMLVRVVAELALLVFIYLPLVVIVALLVPPAVVWLVTWPVRHWPS